MSRRRCRRRLLAALLVLLPAALLLLPRPSAAPSWRRIDGGGAPLNLSAAPGPRYGHVAWPAPGGGAGGYVLGGWGLDGAGDEGRLADLWRRLPAGEAWQRRQPSAHALAGDGGLYDLADEVAVGKLTSALCQVSLTVRTVVLWWGDEITWRLDEDGRTYGPFEDMTDTTVEILVGLGTHEMIALDSYGDGWQGGWWEVSLTESGERLAGGPREGLIGDGEEEGFGVRVPFEVQSDSCADMDLAVYPGARAGAAAAAASSDGSVYVFGGTGHAREQWGALNDLWRYDGERWEWLSGASAPGETGDYGELGEPASSNHPGSRRDHAMWSDASGIWLFGGTGRASATAAALGGIGHLGDLWRWAPNDRVWTWMGGSAEAQSPGTQTSPSSRSGHAVWVDSAGRWLLFGGFGVADGFREVSGPLNDLWMHDGSGGDEERDGPCPDVESWVDIDGSGCAVYLANSWCGDGTNGSSSKRFFFFTKFHTKNGFFLK